MLRRVLVSVCLASISLGLTASAFAQFGGNATTTNLYALQSPDLQKDLQLTADQVTKLQQALQEYNATAQPANSEPGPGPAERQRAAQVAMDNTLTVTQARRLRQVMWQQQEKSNLLSLFRDNSYVYGLGLNDEQSKQLKEIQAEYAKLSESFTATLSELQQLTNEQRQAKFDEVRTKSTESRRASEAKLQALLTPDQQARSKELLGPVFTGQLNTRGGRGFTGATSSRAPGAAPGAGERGAAGDRGPTVRVGGRADTTTRFLLETAFHADLKITAEQAAQLKQFSGNEPPNRAELEKICTPEQLERVHQLMLQYSRQTNGPLGPMRYASVAQTLELTDDQRARLQVVVNEMWAPYIGLQRGDDTSNERAELDRKSQASLAEILNPRQQQTLTDLIGKPFDGPIPPQTRETTFLRTVSLELGRNTPDTATYFRVTRFHDELKLTPEQVTKAAQLSRGAVSMTELEKSFSADQIRRANELAMQSVRQRMGPAGPFGYRPVIEALELSEEQRTKLQVVVNELYGQRLQSRGGAAEQEEENRKGDERIAILLTPQQQATLKKLMGEPYSGFLSTPFPGSDRDRDRDRSSRDAPAGRGPAGFRVGQSKALNIQVVKATALANEFKLTAEQTAAIAGLQNRFGGMIEEDIAKLEKTLTPDQMRRMQELTLQNYRLLWGPIGPFLSERVVTALQVNDQQKQDLQTMMSAVDRSLSGRQAIGIDERDRAGDAKLAEILTAEQLAKLKEMQGAPYQGDLRAALTPAFSGGTGGNSLLGPPFKLGDLAPPTTGYTIYQSVRDHLKLTPEQITKITDYQRRPRGRGEAPPNTDQFKEILTAEQMARLTQINVQGRKRTGPAEIFRYPHVVEAVNLSAEQKTKLEAIGEDFRKVARVTPFTGDPKVTEAAKKAQEQIDALLSPEQKAKIKELLGEPFDFEQLGRRAETERRVGN